MRVEPLPTGLPARVRDTAGEVDVWWDGYALRALLPSFLGCVLLSAGIVLLSYYLWDEHRVRANLARWLAYELNIALWLYHAVRWVWRLGGNIHRLTTRRLYCWRRPLSRPQLVIELTAIHAVAVKQGRFERWLDVGTLIVTVDGQPERVVLRGVRRPWQHAELIRREVEQSRTAAGLMASGGR
ncbi:MAG: PH domain-containing protein [Planctomycetia bacterium]|nr:PH domain-containing protein [Planctomycetia bacterium]